jgi:hypothetical protein
MPYSIGDTLDVLDLAPTQDAIDGAAWACCNHIVELSDGDKRLAVYAGWHGALWPGVQCPTCGEPMAIVVRKIKRVVKREPAPTKLMTTTEIKARRVRRKAGTSTTTDTPLHETLCPWPGEWNGKRLHELPRHVLVRMVAYYSSAKRHDQRRAGELRAAAIATIAYLDARPDTEYPTALIDTDAPMPWEKDDE